MIKNIDIDFLSGFDRDQLQEEIQAVVPSCKGIVVRGKEVEILFESEPDTETITTIDNLVSAHPALSKRILKQILRAEEELEEWMNTKIKPVKRDFFTMLLIEAIDMGYTERKANMYELLGWAKSCVDYLLTVAATIAGSSNPESITWDFETNCPAVPVHTITANYRKND